MPNLAVIGGQWGDEGKGKIVDLLAPRFDVVARFQGGPNAGHTVVFDGARHALHHVPSGIFHEGVRSVIGPGMVVDPDRLLEEFAGLRESGVPYERRLVISTRSHAILPPFKAFDAALESAWGDAAIGTTKRGIGPTYGAKAQRWGIRVGELGARDVVRERLERLLDCGFARWLEHLGVERPVAADVVDRCARWWDALAPMCADTTPLLLDAVESGKPVLFEGAQGTLLDIDHGTYPYVTSSSTTTAGISAGLGVPPRAIDAALGIFKAYVTRVGSGPFPTELAGKTAERLRAAGHEFGTTTGRPRRCGWFDAAAARFAVRINGLDAIAITKFDVLTGFDPIRICVGYGRGGTQAAALPPSVDEVAALRPVYEEHAGWSEDISGARTIGDLPAAARRILDRVTELAGCPVVIVSVGPDREQTIVADEAWSRRFSNAGAARERDGRQR